MRRDYGDRRPDDLNGHEDDRDEDRDGDRARDARDDAWSREDAALAALRAGRDQEDVYYAADHVDYADDGAADDGYRDPSYAEPYDARDYDARDVDYGGAAGVEPGYERRADDNDAYDRNGYDRDGYDHDGYERRRYDQSAYGQNGFDNNGYGEASYADDGYDDPPRLTRDPYYDEDVEYRGDAGGHDRYYDDGYDSHHDARGYDDEPPPTNGYACDDGYDWRDAHDTDSDFGQAHDAPAERYPRLPPPDDYAEPEDDHAADFDALEREREARNRRELIVRPEPPPRRRRPLHSALMRATFLSLIGVFLLVIAGGLASATAFSAPAPTDRIAGVVFSLPDVLSASPGETASFLAAWGMEWIARWPAAAVFIVAMATALGFASSLHRGPMAFVFWLLAWTLAFAVGGAGAALIAVAASFEVDAYVLSSDDQIAMMAVALTATMIMLMAARIVRRRARRRRAADAEAALRGTAETSPPPAPRHRARREDFEPAPAPPPPPPPSPRRAPPPARAERRAERAEPARLEDHAAMDGRAPDTPRPIREPEPPPARSRRAPPPPSPPPPSPPPQPQPERPSAENESVASWDDFLEKASRPRAGDTPVEGSDGRVVARAGRY